MRVQTYIHNIILVCVSSSRSSLPVRGRAATSQSRRVSFRSSAIARLLRYARSSCAARSARFSAVAARRLAYLACIAGAEPDA